MLLKHLTSTFVVALIILGGCIRMQSEPQDTRDPAPLPVVLWISLDGIRPDYLDRAETPFFDKIRAQGAWSMETTPVFPTLTFPTHVSQATGVPVERHGITANSFYDNRTGLTLRFPGDSKLLEAEAIWKTASRQGIRTAVIDWPLSHAQTGDVTADYFGERYERNIPDQERIRRLLNIWQNDKGERPLQLLMGYSESPDRQGHAYGPDSPEVDAAVRDMDALMAQVWERAIEIHRRRRSSERDPLFLVISSDHGMSAVHTLVHPGNLTGLGEKQDVAIVTSGNIGYIHLDRVSSPEERGRIARQTLARLSEFPFVEAHLREDLPERWALRHPHRTGDLVLVLETGYTFSARPDGITANAAEAGGPLGMHGYDPALDPNMLSPLLIHSYPETFGGIDLGPIHHLQLHATICRLLGIEPAPGAGEAIELPAHAAAVAAE